MSNHDGLRGREGGKQNEELLALMQSMWQWVGSREKTHSSNTYLFEAIDFTSLGLADRSSVIQQTENITLVPNTVTYLGTFETNLCKFNLL